MDLSAPNFLRRSWDYLGRMNEASNQTEVLRLLLSNLLITTSYQDNLGIPLTDEVLMRNH